ncbi:MAG: nitrogen fixation protein NifHD [Dehalococcoidia bacterium]|nr:nitrogen fixation protein NifHD [Dehalococcoidia bacterium]
MKEVIAIIRPEKWLATRGAIGKIGAEDIRQHRVTGRGKQRGLRYLRRANDPSSGEMPYLPKRLVVCVVTDEKVAAVVAAIMIVNQTGNVGDGKVFVRSVEVIDLAASEATVAEPAAVG